MGYHGRNSLLPNIRQKRYIPPSPIQVGYTPNCNTQQIQELTSLKRKQRVHDQVNWEWLRSEIYLRDKGVCWVCKEFVLLRDYDLGHLVERSNGGADSLENCAVMHKTCNIAKPRHKSIAEATTWQLIPKNLEHNFKPKLSLISNTSF